MQARGSGTEAVMLLMAKNHGITYGNISYVPGSEVRRGALLQGTIKASIVDAANRRALEAKAPGKFIVLPVENLSATDEASVRHQPPISRTAPPTSTSWSRS